MTMLGMLYKKLRRKVRGYSSEEFIQDLKRGGGDCWRRNILF